MPGDIPSSALRRSLPTLDRLRAKIPPDLDAREVAKHWFDAFSEYIGSRNVSAAANLFLADGFWRDTLALTWEFRTFEGISAVECFLHDALATSGFTNLQLNDTSIGLLQPFPDLAWIQAFFAFETNVGKGTGVLRIVPTATQHWKAHVVYTNLDELKGHPERCGAFRNAEPFHASLPKLRQEETGFENSEPAVLIIGAGQSGLTVAARLKLLGVPTLVVDRNTRVGDQWRGRYESLCLHDPVCESLSCLWSRSNLIARQGLIICRTSRSSLSALSSQLLPHYSS